MKKSIILIALALLGLNLQAQQKVALHHNGVTEIYDGVNSFIQAYDSAIAGDTVYLSGGVFSAPSNINKRLTIYGAGHYPDTTKATRSTVITGTINIYQDADSTFIEGLELSDISIPSNHKVDYLTISRCILGSFTMSGNQTNPCQYLTFKENIVGGINLASGANSIISNNIIIRQIYNGNQNAFYNNILLYESAPNNSTRYVMNNVTNCVVANNIFRLVRYNNYPLSGSTNVISNNVNVANTTGTSNLYSNNYTYPIVDSIFVNHLGNAFSYDDDFHLDSAGVYLGVDSTQVGIYGGLYPWKESSVPSIPHIIYKKIPDAVEPNGTLDIEIKVNAEDY
ncbi:MAG: hypothetical protein KJP21_09590 [Bacteroidia bacterium]|nr:hypothetical protein [Bacteroidia bacterium]NNJ55418.1 hypothetical protein [Bacteroidia bacterium]